MYFGSVNSDFWLVFYEKGYEQAVKFRKELDMDWNKYELRFRQERAVIALREFIKRRDVVQVALEVLNEKVRFLVKPENNTTTRKRLYPTYQP